VQLDLETQDTLCKQVSEPGWLGTGWIAHVLPSQYSASGR
jgi:hypothetical protein